MECGVCPKPGGAFLQELSCPLLAYKTNSACPTPILWHLQNDTGKGDKLRRGEPTVQSLGMPSQGSSLSAALGAMCKMKIQWFTSFLTFKIRGQIDG